MNIPNNVAMLIELINNAGYQAYTVGGFVRDVIIGRGFGDVDIASSATPCELKKILDANGIRYIETGLQHGTISAIIDHEPYEITTFRTEGDYLDNRHPSEVSFVRDIIVDLARRDFTINAIAYNDKDGFVDPFGGIDDINAKIIRCVGNPDERFNEDGLRIMRAIRFASVLGFDVDNVTKDAIFRNKHLLSNIAKERIYTELIKLLLGDNVESVLFEYREVIAEIIPELVPCFDCAQNSGYHIYDVYTHIVKSVAVAPKVDYIRLALLFHDIGKPVMKTTDSDGFDHFKGHPDKSVHIAREILNRLKCSNDIKNKVLVLIKYHDLRLTVEEESIKKWMRIMGEDMFFDYLIVRRCDSLTHNLDTVRDDIEVQQKIKTYAEYVVASGEPYRIKDLAINGNDLIELGFSGKEISKVLEELISLVSGQPNANTREKLLNIALKYIK